VPRNVLERKLELGVAFSLVGLCHAVRPRVARTQLWELSASLEATAASLVVDPSFEADAEVLPLGPVPRDSEKAEWQRSTLLCSPFITL